LLSIELIYGQFVEFRVRKDMKPRHFNFQFSIFNFIVLALLFVGCTKEEENADRINIFANNMSNGSAKVWVDPANYNNATWVADEQVNLNGTAYTINSNGNGSFSLNVGPLDVEMYAIYPATTMAGGNDITVTNNSGSGATIIMKQLAVNFLSSGGHCIIFPMAAKAAADSESLHFDHLTGGLRLTLANSDTQNGFDIHHIKVVVQGTAAAPTVTLNEVNYTVRWEVQGPTMPSGDVGISGDQEVSYSSEMYFNMQHDGAAGVTVPASGNISFCVPVTVGNVKKLSITGYNTSGVQLFSKVKNLDSQKNIAVNYMYNIPSFNIN